MARNLVIAKAATGEVILLLLDPETILDVLDAGHIFDNVLSHSLITAAVHKACESDLAVLNLDVNIRCIEIAVIGQPIVDVLSDAVVRTSVIFWPAAAMTLRPIVTVTIFAAEP